MKHFDKHLRHVDHKGSVESTVYAWSGCTVKHLGVTTPTTPSEAEPVVCRVWVLFASVVVVCVCALFVYCCFAVLKSLFGKTCATTQKNVKSHVFLDFEKKRKKT